VQDNRPVPFDTVDIFDTGTGTWNVAKLSQARMYLAAAVAQNKIFFVGGVTDKEWSDRIDIYDAVTEGWTQTKLSHSFGEARATGSADKIYILGNDGSGSASIEIINVLDLSDRKVIPTKPRHRPCLRVVGDVLFIIGVSTKAIMGAKQFEIDTLNVKTDQFY
jgi:hypothetical protein